MLDKFYDTTGVIRNRKSKDRQYNGQKTEGQTIQWPKDRRTDHTMAKRQKDRQYNGQVFVAQIGTAVYILIYLSCTRSI